MGDFHDRVRKRHNDKVGGCHGQKIVNDDGELLIEIYETLEHRLYVRYFQYRDI